LAVLQEVRPNPRYDTGTYVSDIFPNSKGVGALSDDDPIIDKFVVIDGYIRNTALEKKIEQEFRQVTNEISGLGEFNPKSSYAVPSWWEKSSDYGWGFTHQTALAYMKLSHRYYEAKINVMDYYCNNYPVQTSVCQNLPSIKQQQANMSPIINAIEHRIIVEQQLDKVPEVAKPAPEVAKPAPEVEEVKPENYMPIMIALAVVIGVILLILRRRV